MPTNEHDEDMLVQLALRRRLRPVDLDETIHDAKLDEASAINTEGLAAQIRYLIGKDGVLRTQAFLERLEPEEEA